MPYRYRSPRAIWVRLGRYIDQLTTGGSWAVSLPPKTKHNLHWFWMDGLFSSPSDNIVVTYLVLFILALGATRTQIGLMSALSSLSITLVLLPGARLVERFGHRKWITVIAGGGIARLAILFLVFLPMLLTGPVAVYIAIFLSVSRDAFSSFALPAWTSLSADIVPLSWRGRYFASRNIIMGMGGIVITPIIGMIITSLGQPIGYQIAFGLAFAIGMASTFSFSRIHEPPTMVLPKPTVQFSFSSLLKNLTTDTNFLALCITAALWNFSLNIAGPFFNVYLVQNLQATATVIGFLSITSSLSGLPAQRILGALADRFGPRKVQLVTGLLIPIVPWAWMFVKEPWQVFPINIMSGILWAGYSLASFNFFLSITPEEQRARYSALYQVIVTIALAVGAILGSYLVTRWGYIIIFACSGAGRLISAILFTRFVHQPSSSSNEAEAAI
jgi:MFS family permease